jgi:histidinol dehydrogenase
MAVTDTLRDAAYITVGAAVLGFQKAQVRRHELTDQLKGHQARFDTHIEEGRKALATWTSQLDEVVTPVRTQIEAGLDVMEERLPGAVREAVKQVRTTLDAQQRAARSYFGMTPTA